MLCVQDYSKVVSRKQIYREKKGFLRLSVLRSKRRYLKSSRNLMLLGIACENIAYPHDLPHKIFTWSCVLLSRHKQPPNLWFF